MVQIASFTSRAKRLAKKASKAVVKFSNNNIMQYINLGRSPVFLPYTSID